MINEIKRERALLPYLHNTIEDSGISVSIDPKLEKSDYAAIKVDDYFSGLHLGITPKAVDYIVVVNCECDWYSMYILEFKNVSTPSNLVIRDIHEKFENTISIFLEDHFSDIFLNDRYKYRSVKLFLVSDVYNETGKYKNHAEYIAFKDRINSHDSLKVDFQLSSKLFRFRGKIYKVCYDIPPNPVISKS